MERPRARRLLADVVNLTDRAAVAAAARSDAKTRLERVRADAERRVAAAEAAITKMEAKVAATEERLAEARAAAAVVPPEVASSVMAELAGKRTTKAAVVEALRSSTAGADEVTALAERAGITIVSAGPAAAGAEGGQANGV